MGRIVREISRLISSHLGLTGAKFDIHHYFDEVSEQARDQALKELDSGSCIDRIVWEYLHDDVVIDENNEVQHLYKGIAQGFAVSPFLANYILRDVDEAISKLNVWERNAVKENALMNRASKKAVGDFSKAYGRLETDMAPVT